MKQKLLLKSLLLLFALIAGTSSAWATTVTKTMSEIATANSWVTASGSGTQTCYTSFNLDDNITISTSGSANCGSYWGSDWRLYQTQNGDVTVTANNGYVITSITFTYTVSNSGKLKDGSTNVDSGSKQTFTTINTTKTYTVGNTGSATNGQVKITQIAVTYEDPNIDTLLPENITYSGSGYSAWSSIVGLSSGASYAGNTNNVSTKIQMKNDNSVGIVVTGSAGRVKNISVTWNSGTTTGRVLHVYGTNTPYTTVAVGTNEVEIGSFNSKSSGTDQLTVDASYNYGYIRIAATGGALYLDQIQIEWDKTVVPMTISAATWASFSSASALDFTSTSVTAYIAKEKDGSNVTLTEITKVPASTGIVVNAPAGTYAIPVLAGDADATTGNLLQPWLTAGTPTAGTYYTLAVNGTNPIFKKSSGGTLAAGKAYLVMPTNAPELGVDFCGTTGISTMHNSQCIMHNEVYNLAGQRVAQPTKGLYIVNGKKVVMK